MLEKGKHVLANHLLISLQPAWKSDKGTVDYDLNWFMNQSCDTVGDSQYEQKPACSRFSSQ